MQKILYTKIRKIVLANMSADSSLTDINKVIAVFMMNELLTPPAMVAEYLAVTVRTVHRYTAVKSSIDKSVMDAVRKELKEKLNSL